MAIPLGADEGTSFPEGLDGEARLILDQLQGALDEVDFERATGNNTNNSNDHYDTENNSDDEEDPDSGENELAGLMDSLVAELRADIQEQVVQEFDDDNTEEIQEDRQYNNLPTPGDTNITEDDEAAVVRGPCTRSPGNQENFVSEVSLPSTSKAGDPDHAPVLDHSDLKTPLDPKKKELLRRLLNHLNTGGVSIRRRLYQEMNLQDQQTNEEQKGENRKKSTPQNQPVHEKDRVYQEIPDLQSSPTPVQFERLTPPDTTDPDFVAVQDFTTDKSSLSSTPPQPHHQPPKGQNNKNRNHHDKITRSDHPNTGHIPKVQQRSSQTSASYTSHQCRRQRERQRRRRTNKHKQPYNASDTTNHDDKSNGTNISRANDDEGEDVPTKSSTNTADSSSYRYYDVMDTGVSDDAIRRIADSDTWKRICQLVFRPSK